MKSMKNNLYRGLLNQNRYPILTHDLHGIRLSGRMSCRRNNIQLAEYPTRRMSNSQNGEFGNSAFCEKDKIEQCKL